MHHTRFYSEVNVTYEGPRKDHLKFRGPSPGAILSAIFLPLRLKARFTGGGEPPGVPEPYMESERAELDPMVS